jgi:hypothetical protein
MATTNDEAVDRHRKPRARGGPCGLLRFGGLLACGAMAACGAGAETTDSWPTLRGAEPGQAPAPADGRDPTDAKDLAVLARDDQGDLVIVSASSGRRLASAGLVRSTSGPPAAPNASSAADAESSSLHCLAYDEPRHAALVVTMEAGARAATVASLMIRHAATGEVGFDAPWRWGLAAPGTRVEPTRAGLVLFEQQPAPRWRYIDDDGVTRASILAPLPPSIWRGRPGESEQIGGLVELPATGQGEAPPYAIAVARIDAQGVRGFWLRALQTGGATIAPGARMIAWPVPARAEHGARGVLVDVAEGDVWLRWVEGARASAPMALGVTKPPGRLLEVTRVEASPPSSERGGGALLLALTDAPRLLAVWVGHDRGISQVTELDLGTGSGDAPLGPGPLLAPVTDDRVLVATEQGVLALEVREPQDVRSPAGPLLVADRGFTGQTLRGPLAGPLVLNR